MHLPSAITPTVVLILAPIVLIELAMKIYCIVDLYKSDRRVAGGNKLVWLLLILFISTLGWLVYLLIGRDSS